MLIGVILNDRFMAEKVSPIAIAQIGQWAENVYFGKPCGLMDQMASSVGNIITIDFADPAHPDVEPVQVDFSQAGLALCILDSGADHADLTDEYAAIPNECRAVAAVCGGEVLRDVPFETFIANLPACRKQCGDRAVLRAFHIYADNQRVARQVNALRAGDFETFLQLVNESGTSSWEYLQNVIPAGYKEHQEVAVTIAAAKHFLNGAGAVRVHGGGFAGTVQAFVPLEKLDAIIGSGGLVVMDEDTCMVEVARFFMHFTQNESCGKCTPCREGTKRMLETLERIINNEGSLADLDLLESLSDTITDTALCGLGQTACKPVMSTLRNFRQDYLRHVVDHHCPICNGRKRRLEIKPELCKGCGKCARNCPMEAISGQPRMPYVIDNEKCIHCGACWGACPFGAIDAIEEE